MPNKIESSEIELLEEIGDGSYAVVHKAIYKDEFVAVKKFDGSCPVSCKKQLENEIQILGKLNHHNIIKLLGYNDQRNNNFLVLEYMPGGSLFDLLFSDQQNINSCKLAQDICIGMEYLHANSILHLDLKSSNIILNKAKDRAKITDFGISRISTLTTMNSSNTRIKNAKGTFRWMAPEISKGYPGTRSSDIWSFGCILIEFMTRKLPFDSLSDQQLLAVLQDEKSDLPIKIQDFSKILSRIASECLEREPNKRPTFSQLKISLSKFTQNEFDLKTIDYEINSIRSINDLNRYIENIKRIDQQHDKKDKEIQDLKKKLNEKERDICSINNNLEELKKKFNELEINCYKNESMHQIRSFYWNSILSPPVTPTKHFSYNKSYFPTPPPSYSFIDTTPKHSGKDTGFIYASNGSANGRKIYQGARGGYYYLTAAGNKVYIQLTPNYMISFE